MLYKSIVEKLEIKRGDRIWLSSQLIGLIVLLKKKNIDFDCTLLIDAIIERIGEEGTLLIPTFSFDFSNKGYYDKLKTKGSTGALGNIALSRKDFVRTRHPIHSFAVWGKDQKLLCEMDNKNSFGVDSPFGYCIANHVKQIIVGTDYVHAMTMVHYAEFVCNVPYRLPKKFIGKYVDELGIEEIKTYDYYARRLEIEPEECFNRIGEVLEKRSISKRIDMDGIECYLIDLAKSFPVICDDIINNRCANIYDFNISRNQIFLNV